jgi:hypothetical protein
MQTLLAAGWVVKVGAGLTMTALAVVVVEHPDAAVVITQ